MTLSLKNPLDYPVNVTLSLAGMRDSQIKEEIKHDIKEKEEKDIQEEQGKDGMKKPVKRTDSLSDKGLSKVPKIPVDNSCDNGILDDTAEVFVQ